MKLTFAFVAGWFALAACSPSPQPEPSTPRPPAEAPISQRRPDAQTVAHFWFDYPHQPHPGSRVWIRVNSTNWVEVYPNGMQSRYVLEGKETVQGIQGVVVTKIAGDPENTHTLNDGSFQAFVPDKGSPRMILFFRNHQAGQWQPWRPLAEIELIE